MILVQYLLVFNIKKLLIAYEKKVFSITISVLSYKSTQLKYDVLILVTVAVFTDSQKKENVMVNFAKKICEAAALLRVAINLDPSSFYPVKGEGQYIDNVVKIENKEKSTAYYVEICWINSSPFFL